MATKTFKIGLSNTDKQNMAQDVYERLLALTFAEYDSSKTYNTGDFVVYNDTLYKCKENNVTGTWDSSKWQSATLQDLLDDVEAAVASVNGKANIIDLENGTLVVAKSLTTEQIENISDEVGSTQTAPFLFQATGTDNNKTETPTAPVAKHLELRGNSANWNQLHDFVVDFITKEVNGITIETDLVNKTIRYHGTATANASCGLVSSSNNKNNLVVGHKNLLKFNINGNVPTIEQAVFVSNSLGGTSKIEDKIVVSSSSSMYAQIGILSGATVDFTVQFQCFDITDIYGAGNEPESVVQFNRDYTLPYYSYNARTLKSCKTSALEDVKQNQFQELNAFIEVIAGTEYYISGISAGGYIEEYDGAKNLIKTSSEITSATTIELSENTHYVKVQATTYADIMLCIYWSIGEDYSHKPYGKYRYTLPEVELRSAGNAYDVLYSDGTGKRRIEYVNIIDMINAQYRLTNIANGSGKQIIFDTGYGYLLTHPIKAVYATTKGNILTTLYETVSNNTSYNQTASGTTRTMDNFVSIGSTGFINIVSHDFDNLSTKQDLIDYFTSNPCYIQYELKTEQNIETTSFAENIDVDDMGTMKFVPSADNLEPIIPQGNRFFYPADYVLFLDDMYKRSKDGGEDADANNFVVKSELAFKELSADYIGEITSTQIVSGAFYKNEIAISGGLTNAKYVAVLMSNGNLYPMAITSSSIVCFNGINFQTGSVTVSKIYYKE